MSMLYNVKKHPNICIIAAAQILFVLLLLMKACITPQQLISVDMDSFMTDGEDTRVEDGVLCFFNNNGEYDDENMLTISTGNMRIPSGAYRVDIAYDSYVNENKVNEKNATVSMSSHWRISFDAVSLNDQDGIVTGKLWIPVFTGCNDLKIKVSYNGEGTLRVNGITLTESIRYRFVRVLGFLLLFVLIDLCLLYFFTDVSIPVKKPHVVLIFITAAASLPFCARSLYSGQDLWFHLLRIVTVSEELGNGQFPVRMATELNNGYGYPTPVYYCDLFLYPSAILYRLYVPLRICYQIYVIMVNAATTAFTYLSIGKVTRKSSHRLLGTGLYVLCIYRLVNVNSRAAVGEYTAMTFLPLIVAGLYLIYTKEKPAFEDWIYLTLGMSGVIMSHVLTGEMVVVNIALFCLLLIRKTFRKEVFLSLLKAAVSCAGITAWFLIPFLDYYLHQVTVVQKSDLRRLHNSTKDFMLLLQQFAPGKDGDHYVTIGMPLTLGMGLILYCLVQYKKNGEFQKGKTLRLVSGLAFMNLFFVSKFFPWGPLQNHLGIKGLGYQLGTLQYTWRFLSPASVLLVFAMVIAMSYMEEKGWKRLHLITFTLIGSIFLSTGFFYYRFADEVKTVNYNMMQPYTYTDNLYDLAGTDRTVQNRSEARAISGDVTFSDYERDRGVFKVQVENRDDQTAEVALPVYNHRYFNSYDDQGSLLEEAPADNNRITVRMPALYNGEVVVRFEPPFFWRAAEILSVICVAAVILYARKAHR